MSHKMRSIVAQVYQKSVSMGRSRNFSSSPTNFKESKNTALAKFFVTRTVGLASGYLIGHYLIGDLDKLFDERLQEDLRKAEENFKQVDEAVAYLSQLSKK